jgi:hypothetical protein
MCQVRIAQRPNRTARGAMLRNQDKHWTVSLGSSKKKICQRIKMVARAVGRFPQWTDSGADISHQLRGDESRQSTFSTSTSRVHFPLPNVSLGKWGISRPIGRDANPRLMMQISAAAQGPFSPHGVGVSGVSRRRATLQKHLSR